MLIKLVIKIIYTFCRQNQHLPLISKTNSSGNSQLPVCNFIISIIKAGSVPDLDTKFKSND